MYFMISCFPVKFFQFSGGLGPSRLVVSVSLWFLSVTATPKRRSPEAAHFGGAVGVGGD
jgi:hypothetical protein